MNFFDRCSPHSVESAVLSSPVFARVCACVVHLTRGHPDPRMRSAPRRRGEVTGSDRAQCDLSAELCSVLLHSLALA